MVTFISVLGSSLARLAMVLVLLSIGNIPALQLLWAWTKLRMLLEAGGKPSTRFPPEGLVELTCNARSMRMLSDDS